MAFGISGAEGKPAMLDADVAVAYWDTRSALYFILPSKSFKTYVSKVRFLLLVLFDCDIDLDF